MYNAPEVLGQLLIQAVKKRDLALFQHLVDTSGYLYGEYFKELSEEDQKWAIANRPTEKSKGYRFG